MRIGEIKQSEPESVFNLSPFFVTPKGGFFIFDMMFRCIFFELMVLPSHAKNMIGASRLNMA